MDGGGRIARTLSETVPSRPAAPPAGPAKTVSRPRRAQGRSDGACLPASPRRRGFAGFFHRVAERLACLPGQTGNAAAALIIAAAAAYGAVRGDHIGEIVDFLKDMRDMAANAAGFNIASVALTGNKHLNREEILATAGVTGRASLLFFDVADARARL